MFSIFFGKRDKAEEPPENCNKGALTDHAAPVRNHFAGNAPKAARSPQATFVQMPHPAEAAQASAYDKTRPMPLVPSDMEDMSAPEQAKSDALAVVELHHQRIANTIRTLWGYKECSVYINKLIMAGGDGMGHARVGFNQDAVQAMLTLSDLHDAEFGPPDSIPGGLLAL